MKLKSDCIPCLVERTRYECDMLFEDDREKILVLRDFIAFLFEHLEGELNAPVFFGTARERLLKRQSGVEDPHELVKRRSNKVAKGLLLEAYTFYNAARDKLEALIRIAAAANSMEYGVKGYLYSDGIFRRDFLRTLNEKLNWDRSVILAAINSRDRLIYLTDNAGEVFFDVFVIRELIKMGKEVIVSPKSAPVINDATIEDLKEAGISSSEAGCKIIPSGAYIGVSLEEAEREFMDVFSDDRYLVIAKGMGNYESISEFESKLELNGRLIYLFRAKCEPIANDIGVRRGELVAKFV
ncbi:MAG: DUF89 family protein [Methanophagales archaeon]|nr:DUF89 family protein [Methanophagales archaeon]